MANTYVEKIKEFPGKSWDYVKDNKVKTAVGVGIVIAAVLSVAAYWAFPALGVKAAILTTSTIAAISGGFAAAFTFAATNPITFGLLAIAAVTTIGVLAVKSYNQASQLSEVREFTFGAFQKGDDGCLLCSDDNKPLIQNGSAETALANIAGVIGVIPKGQAKV
ncbi:hypothetical protein IC220_00435 [Wolbachia endosymbiont of Pentalonia nigronervosa]|jgi:hypothetical protein|uniref:hypothetical protein n=1 Tax=Wolbachia endosymbiont of Pentalonia nigronervosa TaxID=1301914 RepID=UPI00165F8C6D|nr:hypothetical protein [Wolbachia endosymbiont of Pentalonia nigronervosa]MBD0390941.1 hypothetical protein [Wolbachia endosymbiont of Pentalonia nigronervosa]